MSQITVQKTIKKHFDLIQILKELNYSDTFPDQLYPALLFRTLFLIDSLHDFSDYTRVADKLYTKQEAINLCNHIINMFKIDCYNIIHYHSQNKLDQYNLLKNIFYGDNLNFFFVFPQLYGPTFFTNAKTGADNKKKYEHMHLNNELFKKQFTEKKNQAFITNFDADTNIFIMKFTGNIYSNKQNLQKPPELHVENLLLIYYKGDKTASPGQTISDKYRNSLNEHCLRKSFDAERNVIDSLHYILSIADILDSCVAYINSSTSKEIISQDNLKRYKSTILEFFNVIPDIKTPIGVPQSSKDGIITSWGFVHGLLNIKLNKCNKDIKPTSKLVFTIDAEGTTGKEYLNMFNRFNFISNDKVYSKLDCISTLGTKFDAANISSFSKLSQNLQKIPDIQLNQQIDNINKHYSNHNYDIILTCGNIVCIHIKYSLLPQPDNVKAQLMNWFNNDFSKIDFSRNNNYSLKDSAIEYVKATNKTDLTIKYGHYFKTVSDVGQLLCFMALINNGDTAFNDALHIFHTNDSFCFSIASLLHYGVVYEDPTQIETDAKTSAQLFENISKTNNKIMISKKCISSKGGFEEYNIEWHKMFENSMSQEKSNELINQAIDNAKKEQTELLERKYLEQINDYKFKNEVEKEIIKAQHNVIHNKTKLISKIRDLKHQVKGEKKKIRDTKKKAREGITKVKNALFTSKRNKHIIDRERYKKEIEKTEESVLRKQKAISDIQEDLEKLNTNDEYHVTDHLSPVKSYSPSSSSSSSLNSRSSSNSRSIPKEPTIVTAEPVQSAPLQFIPSQSEPIRAHVVKRKSPPKSATKRERKRQEKSKKKRQEKTRKRIRSSRSFSRSPAPSRSPAQSRSPTYFSNSNTRKKRKVQSSIPPTSNSKKRQRSSTPTSNSPSSSSPSAKRTRRSSPGASPSSSASGKKTRKKNKK